MGNVYVSIKRFKSNYNDIRIILIMRCQVTVSLQRPLKSQETYGTKTGGFNLCCNALDGHSTENCSLSGMLIIMTAAQTVLINNQ